MKSDVISSDTKTSKSEVICFSILYFACHFTYTRTFIFNLKLRGVNLRLSTLLTKDILILGHDCIEKECKACRISLEKLFQELFGAHKLYCKRGVL